MPVGIDEWRKPAVLEKTRTLYGASAALAGVAAECGRGEQARRSGGEPVPG